MSKNSVIEIGQRFSRLVVEECVGRDKYQYRLFMNLEIADGLHQKSKIIIKEGLILGLGKSIQLEKISE
jgi:hypothetical protein